MLSEKDEYTAYLTHMRYFATGEGITEEINFCYAKNKAEAKQKHLNRFYPNSPESADFFGVGVEMMKFNSDESKELCKQIFSNGEAWWKAMLDGGIEMYFKRYLNNS